MMHSDFIPSTKGITRIGFLSVLCLIWTQQAYASSAHTSGAASDFVSGNHKLLVISTTGIKNNAEKIFNHEQKMRIYPETWSHITAGQPIFHWISNYQFHFHSYSYWNRK